MYILGFESSCDETAASIVKDGREIISNIVYTQVEEHGLYGGVSANTRLRELIEQKADGRKFYAPRISLCGDNGAMIAAQGYYEFINGKTAGLDLNGIPSLPIDFDC